MERALRLWRSARHGAVLACCAVALAASASGAQEATPPPAQGTDWFGQIVRELEARRPFARSVWPVRSLRCSFGEGYVAAWNSPDRVTIEPSRWGTNDGLVIFDNINATTGTARIIGSAGAADVVVLPSERGVVFLERTPVGNMIMTTVYGFTNEGSSFSAVMSRHITLSDAPIASSYHGQCVRTD